MLKNKVAVVTGAGMGIGQAVALVFAREGAKVVVSDINTKAGEETVALLHAAGADATFVKADVSSPEDCERLVERTVAHYGRLDVACNNAGIVGHPFPVADYPLESWEQVIKVDLSGVFYCMKYEIAAMLKTGGGSIVNISSRAGAAAMPEQAAYTAAKHGVVGLTKTAGVEYAARGVRVNAVGPGLIKTPLSVSGGSLDFVEKMAATTPIRRLGEATEVGELVAWLASDRASFVTGAYYPVDGGTLAC